ncbi:hypothetical protein HKX48_007402 [Thoreauomyces humboldtii]|nr:hypothetical protein HKX48_007402 [Thoreauomyces humboldtii]
MNFPGDGSDDGGIFGPLPTFSFPTEAAGDPVMIPHRTHAPAPAVTRLPPVVQDPNPAPIPVPATPARTQRPKPPVAATPAPVAAKPSVAAPLASTVVAAPPGVMLPAGSVPTPNPATPITTPAVAAASPSSAAASPINNAAIGSVTPSTGDKGGGFPPAAYAGIVAVVLALILTACAVWCVRRKNVKKRVRNGDKLDFNPSGHGSLWRNYNGNKGGNMGYPAPGGNINGTMASVGSSNGNPTLGNSKPAAMAGYASAPMPTGAYYADGQPYPAQPVQQQQPQQQQQQYYAPTSVPASSAAASGYYPATSPSTSAAHRDQYAQYYGMPTSTATGASGYYPAEVYDYPQPQPHAPQGYYPDPYNQGYVQQQQQHDPYSVSSDSFPEGAKVARTGSGSNDNGAPRKLPTLPQ